MSNSEPRVYPGYKVSQFSDKKYQVDESNGVPARQQSMSDLEKRLESAADIDFKKKHSMKNDGQEYKQEYKTTGDALRELSPWNVKQQLAEIKSLTPEEYEAICDSYDELRANSKTYALYFGVASFSFAYW